MSVKSSIAVRITNEGMLPIPKSLRQELGLKPAQIVQLRQENGDLLVRRLSAQELGEQIVASLKQALAGARWEDIVALRAKDEDWR